MQLLTTAILSALSSQPLLLSSMNTVKLYLVMLTSGCLSHATTLYTLGECLSAWFSNTNINNCVTSRAVSEGQGHT